MPKLKTKKLIYFDSKDIVLFETRAKSLNISFSEYVRIAVASHVSQTTKQGGKKHKFKTFTSNNPFKYKKPDKLSQLIDQEIYD
jgi:hypothetical protein